MAHPKTPSFRIVVDTREQTPLPLPAETAVRGTLRTGDYSVQGFEHSFTVERKSLPDLVNTIIHDRERFEYELLRMMKYQFRRVLVEASFADAMPDEGYTFSQAKPKSVINSVYAFEVRYGVPFVFAGGRLAATKLLMGWAEFFVRELSCPRGW